MMRTKNIILSIVIMLFISSCREEYNPVVAINNSNYLVVQGYINTGGGTTTFNLSRTAPLKNITQTTPEINAMVDIQGDDNSDLVLPQTSAGAYSGSIQSLKTQVKYRVHIKTSNGEEYVSDYTTPRTTPPIDSINYKMDNTGLNIFVNTHDPANNTRYYKWNYSETWEIQSADTSLFEFRNNQVINRDPAINVYTCWSTATSTDIIINSSAKLTNDVIQANLVTVIPSNSEKISKIYSILINQYGLDDLGYAYLENIKKNTEQLGSVFSPLPSDVKGNIHCVNNPNELVIGYINAGIIQQKRIFINRDFLNLPSWKAILANTEGCTPFLVPNKIDSLKKYSVSNLLTLPFYGFGGVILAYYSEPARCIDCRLRGGNNIKPSFWPY